MKAFATITLAAALAATTQAVNIRASQHLETNESGFDETLPSGYDETMPTINDEQHDDPMPDYEEDFDDYYHEEEMARVALESFHYDVI